MASWRRGIQGSYGGEVAMEVEEEVKVQMEDGGDGAHLDGPPAHLLCQILHQVNHLQAGAASQFVSVCF